MTTEQGQEECPGAWREPQGVQWAEQRLLAIRAESVQLAAEAARLVGVPASRFRLRKLRAYQDALGREGAYIRDWLKVQAHSDLGLDRMIMVMAELYHLARRLVTNWQDLSPAEQATMDVVRNFLNGEERG